MIKKFIIDRKEWYPAEVHRDVLKIGEGLLHTNGRMCCLGVFLKANGIGVERMTDHYMPVDILEKFDDKELCELMIHPNVSTDSSDFAMEAAHLNDYKKYDMAKREQEIIKLFAEQGIEVTFTGNLDLDEVRNNRDKYIGCIVDE